nr:hypothetical protein [Candidatus Sigynarchaeum springense]MDO8116271.1 hypothetical protein [Candidatus Sigynarchaeota archaeon]
MKSVLDDAIQEMLNAARLLNKKAFTIDRCIILVLLYCCSDGLQYRELKNMLEISDGKLIADLTALVKEALVQKRTELWDNKSLDIYTIDEHGIAEVERCKAFFDACQKIRGGCK